MLELMPLFAEHDASRSDVYHKEIRYLISPVALFLEFCSAISNSTYLTYTPKPLTNSFFYINDT